MLEGLDEISLFKKIKLNIKYCILKLYLRISGKEEKSYLIQIKNMNDIIHNQQKLIKEYKLEILTLENFILEGKSHGSGKPTSGTVRANQD